MKKMKVDELPKHELFQAHKQDIFRESISPMASEPTPEAKAWIEDAARKIDRVIAGPSCPCGSCKRTQKEQDISFRLREMGDIELDILLSTQARLLMGQGQYGKFEETDVRNMPKEALEEVQDALVYVAKRLGELGR